jgi:PAS domain-containing protein
MNDGDATQILATLGWHDPRIHLLDDTWLLTIFAILFATAVPWLVSGLAIDFVATAGGLLTLGAVHVAFAALADRSRANPSRRTRTLAGLHALGVIAIAFIWQHAGGLQNPLFLMVFALPVIGSIFLSRWQPYFMAALAAVVVTLIASSEAPELRWYAPGLNVLVGWVDALLGKGSGGAGLPFAGFYAPSEYFVVLLEVFVTMLLACAVAAEYLGTIFERLRTQVAAARAEAERGQQLWSALMEQLPLPAFLVDTDTSEVICASAAALAKLEADEDRVVGRDLFEVIRFSYPDVVQELVSGPDGVARLCMIRLNDRLLATEVRVQHVAQKGRRFALVIVSDITEAFCVKAALDVAEHAALVVNSQGRVLAFNKPAGALFSEAEIDADVSRLLPQSDAQARWWDPGLSGRRKMHATIAQRVYQVTSSAVALPGEDERLYVVAFLPVARVAAADQSGTGWTTLVQRP